MDAALAGIMPEESSLERDIRELRGTLATLAISVAQTTTSHSAMDKRLGTIEAKLDAIWTHFNQQKGSWRTLSGLLAAAGVVGGIAAELVRHVH